MNEYDACALILTDALEKMAKEGLITKSEILPTLVDFTATIAISLGGPEAVKACAIRFGDCLESYRNGTFPVDSSGS